MTTTAPGIDDKDAVEAESEEFDAEVEDEPEANPAGEFSLVLIDESGPTVDGRYFVPGKVTWREPPIPLLYTTTNGNGHKGGEVGGAITKIWREDDKIKGFGHFESGEHGQELRRLITEGVLTGVSADVGGAMVELEAATETTKEMQKISEGKILGVTALPLQAYDDTRIAVTAAAIPAAPPKDWFENPGLKKVTPISVTADGRVYGHVAAWGTCHVGFNRPGECLTPPHSASNYSHFTIGEVLTDDGETVPTGPITLGTGHAGLTLNANAARDHYDNTGTAVADVRAGEDQFGIWVSGAMRPSVTDDKIREFRASAPSGDWRNIGGTLEMVGVLAVNVPGFPIPRAKVEFADEQPLSLVAAGAVPISEFTVEEEDCGCELSLDEQLTTLESQIEELAAKMLADGEFRNYEIPNAKSSVKEIEGSHDHEPHGTSILWPAMYEELRKKGMTKEKAARISNANWNRKHKAPGSKAPGRFAALIEEFHGSHDQDDHGNRGTGPNGTTPGGVTGLARAMGQWEIKPNKKKIADFKKAVARQDAAVKTQKKELTGENPLELAAQTIEEFRNTHASRQNRDGHGRFAEHGGLGGLANKYKGPNKGKKLSKGARGGADTGSSGYKGAATTIQEKDGSASERAAWKRKEAARKLGTSELDKIKAERQAKAEKIKARALARQSPAKREPAKAMDEAIKKRNSPAGKYAQSQERKATKPKPTEPDRRTWKQQMEDDQRAKAPLRAAKAKDDAERQKKGDAEIAAERAADPVYQAALKKDRSGSPKASPKPAQPVYRSVAEKIAERDGSAREKAAWSRKEKNRPLGESELAKEKAVRKAKLEAAKARARARAGK